MSQDIFTAHYRRLITDERVRADLIADPKGGLTAHFGSVPDGDYRVEVVEQRSDTITILVPAPPGDEEDPADRLDDVAGRIYDILHTTGIGGYFVPDDSLTWVLRDMRSTWARDAGSRLP